MKILHIINTAGVSGAEKHLRHLLPGLKDHGVDCELMLICPTSALTVLTAFAEEFKSLGIKVTIYISDRFLSFGLLKK